MKKLILLLIMAFIIGCAEESKIKTTYGEWESVTVTVAQIKEGNATLLSKNKETYTLKNRGWKEGQQVTIEMRKVYTSFCEDGHCELLKTEAEIK